MKKLIPVIIALLSTFPSLAQGTLGMTEECYAIYESIRSRIDDDAVRPAIDSLISKGEEIGDVRALTLGYQYLIAYYTHRDDEAMMLQAAREARSVDLKYGSDPQYFMTYRGIVKYYLDRGRVLEALDLASEMQDDPHTFEVPIGQYSFYHTMAIICGERDMTSQARDFYFQAISVAKENDFPSMSLGELYTRAAELYPMDSDSCLVVLKAAEPYLKAPLDTFHVYSTMALCSAVKGDVQSYRHAMDSYNEYFSRFPGRNRGNFDFRTRIASAVMGKRWAEAISLCDSLSSESYAGRVRLSVADMSGDAALARKAAGMLIAYNDSMKTLTSAQNLAEMGQRYKRSKAETQAMEAELELQRLHERQRRSMALVAIFAIMSLMVLYMTFRNRRLKEQKRLNATLKQASDMKTDFVHNMSHEIRTPLNAILGFSQLLSLPDDFVTPEERKQYGEYIANNGQMLMMLVNDILCLSDVEQGRINISYGDVNVREVVESSLNSVRERVPDGVELRSTTDCPDPCIIRADALRVQQILINFLTNACKNTTKGEIHVHSSLDETPGYLTLSVADTGCGVDPAMAEAIFDRFTKLDEFKQGNGLGLNLCRKIAQNMNGRVYLDTAYKGGARFVFAIPAKP